MKIIKSTNGFDILVDNDTYKWAKKYNWNVNIVTKNVTLSINNKRGLYLHRLIMNPGKGKVVDHINNNPLDNRKKNLRIATHSQNHMNRGMQSNNTTGYKGVCYVTRLNKYCAQISSDGIHYLLGHFNTSEEAAKVYNDAAKRLHGEFAYLNEI